MSLYQKLYPNLNFNQTKPPSAKTMNILETSTNVRSNSVPRVVEPVREPSQPKTVATEPVVEPITHKEEPIVKRADKPKRKVVIKEAISQKPDSPVQTVTVEDPPKPKPKRPNRVKPEPKPEPKRSTTIPKKGEQGLQPRYSFEQKKSIYLDKLSRKSCKNAEKEVSKVNEILEKVDHDPDKLKLVEREMKQRLKLINSAKFFADQKKPPTPEISLPVPVPEPVPVVPSDSDASETDYSSGSDSD